MPASGGGAPLAAAEELLEAVGCVARAAAEVPAAARAVAREEVPGACRRRNHAVGARSSE